PGGHVPPARRAALPAADRTHVPGVLREPRLARRAMDRTGDRTRQPRDRLPPGGGRHVLVPPLPGQPAVALARLGRLRLAGRTTVPARQRAAPDARVRRPTIRWIRTAHVGSGG